MQRPLGLSMAHGLQPPHPISSIQSPYNAGLPNLRRSQRPAPIGGPTLTNGGGGRKIPLFGGLPLSSNGGNHQHNLTLSKSGGNGDDDDDGSNSEEDSDDIVKDPNNAANSNVLDQKLRYFSWRSNAKREDKRYKEIVKRFMSSESYHGSGKHSKKRKSSSGRPGRGGVSSSGLSNFSQQSDRNRSKYSQLVLPKVLQDRTIVLPPLGWAKVKIWMLQRPPYDVSLHASVLSRKSSGAADDLSSSFSSDNSSLSDSSASSFSSPQSSNHRHGDSQSLNNPKRDSVIHNSEIERQLNVLARLRPYQNDSKSSSSSYYGHDTSRGLSSLSSSAIMSGFDSHQQDQFGSSFGGEGDNDYSMNGQQPSISLSKIGHLHPAYAMDSQGLPHNAPPALPTAWMKNLWIGQETIEFVPAPFNISMSTAIRWQIYYNDDLKNLLDIICGAFLRPSTIRGGLDDVYLIEVEMHNFKKVKADFKNIIDMSTLAPDSMYGRVESMLEGRFPDETRQYIVFRRFSNRDQGISADKSLSTWMDPIPWPCTDKEWEKATRQLRNLYMSRFGRPPWDFVDQSLHHNASRDRHRKHKTSSSSSSSSTPKLARHHLPVLRKEYDAYLGSDHMAALYADHDFLTVLTHPTLRSYCKRLLPGTHGNKRWAVDAKIFSPKTGYASSSRNNRSSTPSTRGHLDIVMGELQPCLYFASFSYWLNPNTTSWSKQIKLVGQGGFGKLYSTQWPLRAILKVLQVNNGMDSDGKHIKQLPIPLIFGDDETVNVVVKCSNLARIHPLQFNYMTLETATTLSLKHPNIIRALAWFVRGDVQATVMERGDYDLGSAINCTVSLLVSKAVPVGLKDYYNSSGEDVILSETELQRRHPGIHFNFFGNRQQVQNGNPFLNGSTPIGPMSSSSAFSSSSTVGSNEHFQQHQQQQTRRPPNPFGSGKMFDDSSTLSSSSLPSFNDDSIISFQSTSHNGKSNSSSSQGRAGAAGYSELYVKGPSADEQDAVLAKLKTNALLMDSAMNDWELNMYLLDIIRALEYLHARGIVHRDVKPANIMICSPTLRSKTEAEKALNMLLLITSIEAAQNFSVLQNNAFNNSSSSSSSPLSPEVQRHNIEEMAKLMSSRKLAKLIDHGLAIPIGSFENSAGTNSYIPKVLRNAQCVINYDSGAVDIYAFAKMIYSDIASYIPVPKQLMQAVTEIVKCPDGFSFYQTWNATTLRQLIEKIIQAMYYKPPSSRTSKKHR